ncbi:Bardet-Biedl syndrome 5 protein homolog [Achroia grisella]|uniref:Bardet-Biedl syndrome 5 protein homolog n=1 Tax=Achroia grisella TaxID=688607 RepID=UPI0027D2BA99|nr:Bardet-Biedl syndrome 5 protein homolog [Achroia grisella]
MSKSKTNAVWEDREVLFDLPFSYLKLRPGEKIFDRIEPIEDTKGNSGTKGRMVVTNLRIIWHSLASPRINLSIGLNCILSTTTKIVNSGLRGTTQALYALAAYKMSRYEFIFTNLSPNSVRHYTSVVGVHKAYANSRMYRNLKLRGAIVHNKQLRMLPLEKINLNEHSIWNLSTDSGNLGTMVVTNVRVVWYADVNDAFNVSMPYITIETISVRDSKFGEALVFVIRQFSGGYVLGFRADPPDRLRPLLAELQALHQAYTERPIFGLEITWDHEIPKSTTDDIEELEEIGEPRGEMGPNLYLASQLAQTKPEGDIQLVYNPYLGLAIEPLKEGFTLKSLFEVQTTS